MVNHRSSLFSCIVMLNLFQHPTGLVTIVLKTLHMGCRNKFGMTSFLLSYFPSTFGALLSGMGPR
jgi:hypothetical protein